MPNQLFTWAPDEGSKQDIVQNIKIIKFGDGYEQRVKTGINNVYEVWDVEFTGNKQKIDEIRLFLRQREGVEKFDWKTPFGDQLVFVCDKWSIKRSNVAIYTLSATFRQVFDK